MLIGPPAHSCVPAAAHSCLPASLTLIHPTSPHTPYLQAPRKKDEKPAVKPIVMKGPFTQMQASRRAALLLCISLLSCLVTGGQAKCAASGSWAGGFGAVGVLAVLCLLH